MLTPNAHRARVAQAKITRYLLDPTSPDGGPKARCFLARGFTPSDWRVMARAFKRLVASTPYARMQLSVWGIKYIVDGPIACPDGSAADVRTIWIISPEDDTPLFVTAFPLKRRGRDRT